MEWIEVSLETDGEAAEAIADLMQQYGYQGVVIEQLGIDGDAWEEDLVHLPSRVIVRAYLPQDGQTEALKRKLEDGLRYLHQISESVPTDPTYTVVREEDWAEAWKVHYRPLRVGERFFIRPEWTDVPASPEDIEIVLDPGMAFGTGTHPSTQLCLIALENQDVTGKAVLDLGCGSGILGIGAARMGAASIRALDTDGLAVKATAENAERNGVRERFDIAQGSLEDLLATGEQFDIILVNILARIIIPMCDAGLGEVVRPGGIAIFSGIIEEQAEDVEAALRRTGLIPYRRHQMADWIGIEARRE
ncbi:MAG: 50S ribosomal protein L11 methyltransferase [Anaerolineae bacterium]